MKRSGTSRILAVIPVMVLFLAAGIIYASTAAEINSGVREAMKRFLVKVRSARYYLKAAKGVLVIPDVKQAGLIIGGEYGEGSLIVNGKTIYYYNLITGSVGLQAGVQKKDIILIFLSEPALRKFESSDNWQAEADGSVTMITNSAEESIDTTKLNEPIIGFVSGQEGLMAGAVIGGTKFSKIKK